MSFMNGFLFSLGVVMGIASGFLMVAGICLLTVISFGWLRWKIEYIMKCVFSPKMEE